MSPSPFVVPFQALRLSDVDRVGGKNAALGELLSQLAGRGIRVPDGFATTAEAFREVLRVNGLEAKIAARLEGLNVDDVAALAKAGAEIRGLFEHAVLPERLEAEVRSHYQTLTRGLPLSVAVRSSATAEDLPDASFAGQQETFLNVVGIDAVLERLRHVFASLYNDRAIAYRVHQGFAHSNVALSVGVQHMVRSDLAASGVLFTLDTESGFRDVVFITSSYGLGETVVQGAVNPDEFTVHKPTLRAGKRAIVRRALGSKRVKMEFEAGPARVRTVDVPEADQHRFSLSDDEVLELARFALTIEEHTGRPMDIEWGKDGVDGKLYILQARPETVKSRERADVVERFRVTGGGEVLVTGRAIGQKVGVGPVRVVPSVKDIERVRPGDVLVTDMTDPNWEPVMKRASAIVTNRGGRTCHAAIIARELGIPAIVGCGEATARLPDGATVTVSCAEGDTGRVYAGRVPFEVEQAARGALPPLATKLMMNVGSPELAFEFAATPNAGVGLARVEFVVNGIGVHPKAALHVDALEPALAAQVRERSRGYESPRAFFREKLAEGVATIAAAFWPKPVIVRLSDFKSNEYRKLLGGERFEPVEENPMIGFRGASRYVAADFADCFALECEALAKVRGELGLTNVELMVPFVRTLSEARRVTEALARHGLSRGADGLRLIMMCEVPSNAILAREFLEYFDGFSIGSNDLTQLTLGLDRDSGLVADAFDERDPAVKALLSLAIRACLEKGKYIGICGQGPSDHLDFAKWLVAEGIGSISLNPDTVVDTWKRLAAG
ncbi:MAG: phosphoenolpyruvate synthase [Myxococcaceae bacterium]|jgi:pyruvate,water dikinase|nr:phosphoenolpyruvate synthase [Myxococcaceae bacterium]